MPASLFSRSGALLLLLPRSVVRGSCFNWRLAADGEEGARGKESSSSAELRELLAVIQIAGGTNDFEETLIYLIDSLLTQYFLCLETLGALPSGRFVGLGTFILGNVSSKPLLLSTASCEH